MATKNDGSDDLLPGAPPPARIGIWRLAAATLAGRRDSRRQVVTDACGYLPYTRRLEARVRLAESDIGVALERAVDAIDQTLACEIASLESLAQTAENEPDEPVAPEGRPSDPAQIRVCRQADRRRIEEADRRRRAAAHRETISRCRVRRERVHATARARLDSYRAQHDAYCAAHARALRTPPAGSPGSAFTPPTYVPRTPWVTSDIGGPARDVDLGQDGVRDDVEVTPHASATGRNAGL